MPIRRLTAPDDAPPQLDKFLARAVPNMTLERARTLLREGRVRINGKAAKINRRLWGGEQIELHLEEARLPQSFNARAGLGPKAPPPAADALAGESTAPMMLDGPIIEVLHETKTWLVVNKPPGIVVTPEPNQVSMVELVATQFQGFDVGGLAMPGVVHRLDKDTSGCLIFAKTDDGHRGLQAAFEQKHIDKIYWALVVGVPPASGQCDTPYAKDPNNPRKYTGLVPSARRARLSFRTLETFRGLGAEELSLVEVTLDTGRTHQIRVQLSERGFAVLGDPIYGPKEARLHPVAKQLGRLALHAKVLRIGAGASPIEAPLPNDFAQVLHELRITAGKTAS